MIKIADILEEDTHEIKEWISRTEVLGSTEELLFCNYDLISKDWIRKQTISSLIPIYTGLVPKDQIDLFEKWITHARSCTEGKCHTPATQK